MGLAQDSALTRVYFLAPMVYEPAYIYLAHIIVLKLSQHTIK